MCEKCLERSDYVWFEIRWFVKEGIKKSNYKKVAELCEVCQGSMCRVCVLQDGVNFCSRHSTIYLDGRPDIGGTYCVSCYAESLTD
jgi:hypothetical protein